MSLKTKKLSVLTLKVIAVGLFMFLAIVNVQMVDGKDDTLLDLAGIKLSVLVTSVNAEAWGKTGLPGSQCTDPNGYYVQRTGYKCINSWKNDWVCNVETQYGWCCNGDHYCFDA